ncbi:MAG: DNA-binding protein Alba [Thermoprotei archaeon]|nr:MAG: DNA-binding protein Alba [Thermoprotei archaeon]RLF25911.1 MAG: DNA-binding protein Alba [Thermoprotei archaeon]
MATEEPVVYVGNKPIMSYVLACLTLFHEGASEVCIKARGKFISKAVDVVRMVTENFMWKVRIKDIKIGSEFLTDKKGSMHMVSTISIILTKEGG